jgi:hypothetical protein
MTTTWLCRHEPPCYTDLQHLERCGEDVSDETWSDPMCIEHGFPAPDCDVCNREREDFVDEEKPLVRDEVVYQRQPGYVVVQVSEESLRTLRRFVAKCTCMCKWVGEAKAALADVLKQEG